MNLSQPARNSLINLIFYVQLLSHNQPCQALYGLRPFSTSAPSGLATVRLDCVLFWPRSAVRLPAPFSQLDLSNESLLVLGAYVLLAGLYLVVVPLALIWWMQRRWTLMGKIERTAIYGLVFLFFPGLILFAPFLNLRMAGQGEVGG